MDALEFLKERKRMCSSYEHCENCPLKEFNCTVRDLVDSDEDYKRVNAAVEQWSKEHPVRTRQSMFLEQWPEAKMTKDGVISICLMAVSAAYRNKTGGCVSSTRPQCAECGREFWMQEVE